MAQSRYKRKLTAILSADVVEYSRLMGDDEEFTIQNLNSYRDIMTAVIEQYSGSVVDAVGDNLLAEFTSVVDAVQCAAAIQMKLKKQNDNLSVKRQMFFRIGINIGDIVHEKNRIYGDGVNIAARIESLADPGGICISRGTYDHIKKKLDFEYEYLGEHSVKNIADPVRVYKIIMDPKEAKNILKQKSGHTAKKPKLKKWLIIIASVILILLALLAGGLYWKYLYLPAPHDIDPDSDIEFNLPEGPSIAVLPFVNMSKDPEQEYFCDGITENIIASLAQTKLLFVIARNSTFFYKGKSINVQQIGKELNAEYVIEGSIQKADEIIRIVVQLIETSSGLHIWSERYDRQFKDIFKLQDEITLEILGAVNIKVALPYGKINTMEGIADINSFIKLIKFHEYMRNPTKSEYASVFKNVREIIALNPEFPYRYDMLAGMYNAGIFAGECESNLICLSKAIEANKKSLSINNNNPIAYYVSGWIFVIRKEYSKAMSSFKKAISLDPIYADAYSAMGYVFMSIDKPSKALESYKTALRLNPIPPIRYLLDIGVAYRYLEEYEKAIQIYKRCMKRAPHDISSYMAIVVAYSLAGQEDNAKIAAGKLLNLFPDYSIEVSKKYPGFNSPDQHERVIKALRNAGVPETSQ